MVVIKFGLNESRANCEIKQVLPTAESPIVSSLMFCAVCFPFLPDIIMGVLEFD